MTALIICLITGTSRAQSDSALVKKDSAITQQSLSEVIITAYGQRNALQNVPAAVNTIASKELSRYSNTSILPAVNATPGVQMEERSPASYRFSVRGSSLRSPFGVRNVKVYYNDIPFTDPGGTTYLNSLGFYNFSSLEIIKGPGSSLYGAGTGGVLLINSFPVEWRQGAAVYFTGGSFGLLNAAAEVAIGKDSFQNIIRLQHAGADGYREQSNSRRDVASWDGVKGLRNGASLQWNLLYSDLYYQTPGALTLAEWERDPRAARRRAGATPGAAEAAAAIYQKTALLGITYKQELSAFWRGQITLYGAYTQQVNPNLRNYSDVEAPHFGGRIAATYNRNFRALQLAWISGGEVQQGYLHQTVSANNGGTAGAVQSDARLRNTTALLFTQASLGWRKWSLTAGLSYNRLSVDYTALQPKELPAQKVVYNPFAPRVALLYKPLKNLSLFAAAERGFSPPTVDELAPTGSALSFSLQPEQGWNYESSIRGSALRGRLTFDATLFDFQLQDAIVQRRDSAGGDYYLNAGSTHQQGVEVALRYRTGTVFKSNVYCSYTFNDFRYRDFVKLGGDYSGNRLPGTSPHAVAAGADIMLRTRWMLAVTYLYRAVAPLNDAATASLNDYHLVGAKLSYAITFRQYSLQLFAGGDNLLDVRYSLGPDLNAAAGRYYNAAAGVNFFGGLSMQYASRRKG